MSLPKPSYFGYLTFEEVPGTDKFVRRFFVLDKTNARLEYYTDDSSWVIDDLLADLYLLSWLFLYESVYDHELTRLSMSMLRNAAFLYIINKIILCIIIFCLTRPPAKSEVAAEAFEVRHSYSHRAANDSRHLVAQNWRPPASAAQVHLLTKLPISELCKTEISEARNWLFQQNLTIVSAIGQMLAKILRDYVVHGASQAVPLPVGPRTNLLMISLVLCLCHTKKNTF